MSILQTVRTLTRPKHDLMENLIGSDRLTNFSIEDYKLLLSTNFVFHSHLEKKIEEFISNEELQKEKFLTKFDFEERIKSISLEHELQSILPSFVFAELKNIENTVSFIDYSSLLGRVYVAEGSMLGGKMMYKILSQNSQINVVTNFDFFKSFQEAAFPLWKSFKELVEEQCITEKQKENFLNGAEESYHYFEKSFYTSKSILD